MSSHQIEAKALKRKSGTEILSEFQKNDKDNYKTNDNFKNSELKMENQLKEMKDKHGKKNLTDQNNFTFEGRNKITSIMEMTSRDKASLEIEEDFEGENSRGKIDRDHHERIRAPSFNGWSIFFLIVFGI